MGFLISIIQENILQTPIYFSGVKPYASSILNPHFAIQNGAGFNPDVELLRVCETFSFLEKDEQTLSSSKS